MLIRLLVSSSALVVMLFYTSLTVAAESHANSTWAWGGAIGQAFPTGPSDFSSNEAKKLHGSIFGRYFFTPSLGVELNFNALNFEGRRTTTPDTDINAISVNAAYRLSKMGHFTPLFALGLGAGKIADYTTKTYEELFALARAGVEYDLVKNLALGAHVQFSYLPETSGDAASEIHALSYLISLSYGFGDSESPVAAETRQAKETPVVAADADGDGVSDDMDKCTSSAAGAKVNAYGCEVTDKVQFKLNLVFPTGKAVLTADQMEKVKELAKFLTDYPATQAVIEGHTDNTGSEAMNKKISSARAEAVREGLHKNFGIDLKRISAKGFGSSQPLADNTTAEGREQNRRVIATISETK